MARIGMLNERVTIQRYTESRDDLGGVTRTWGDLRSCAARVRPVKGREADDAGRLAAIETYLVDIRWWQGITPRDRLVWRGRVLNIRSVENRDERRRFLTMECEAGVVSD